VAEGLTVIEDEVAPLLQTYDDPPLAVSVVDAPAQIEDEEALTLIDGNALTTTLTLPMAEQPLEFVPVTL
jgi:hypothetical protein